MDRVTQLCELARTEIRHGNLPLARTHLQQAQAVAPDNIECLGLLAELAQREGRVDSALEIYLTITGLVPRSPQAHLAAGLLYLNSLHNYREARHHLGIVIQDHPENLFALNNYGIALLKCGSTGEAIECFDRILKVHPHSQVHTNMAAALLAINAFDAALTHHQAANRLSLEERKTAARPANVRFGRLVHDLEQLHYLRDRGLIDGRHDRSIAALESVIRNARDGVRAADDPLVPIGDADFAAICPLFFEQIYAGDGSRVPGDAINPKLDFDDIGRQFNARRPEIIHIDGFLTDEALDKLYKYCLETTMFRKEYPGYLGATMDQGFASPLLFQIASEMQAKFPAIIRHQTLTQCWVFKHGTGSAGINMHADFAAVNINFWITPDEANLAPGRGGVVVWDKESPRDWDFADYQIDQRKIQRFLADSGAQPITVPYRRNRAVIFNSTLFHKTDDPQFRDGYEQHRLNVTFLFGESLRTAS